MNKSEMERKFRVLLDTRKELLKRAVEGGSQVSAMTLCGEICGVAASMRMLGLLDYEQQQYLQGAARGGVAGFVGGDGLSQVVEHFSFLLIK